MEGPRTDQPDTIPEPMLERIWFYVNFDCNLSCSYCVADSGPGTQRKLLELNAFRQMATEAVSLGFRQLVITGGEPLLHPDILPILEYAGASQKTLLLTNATLITAKRIQPLKRLSRIIEVQVSLDSADPAIHDRLRGDGSWMRAVDGTTLLLDWGFSVSVRTTRVGQSQAEIDALGSFLGGIGVPPERYLTAPVAMGGRSTDGLRMETTELLMEPTVAADGIYSHPLKIAPELAVAATIRPLKPGLRLLAEQVAANPLGAGKRYR